MIWTTSHIGKPRTQWQTCSYSTFLLLSDFYTRLLRPNKIETGRGLST